MSATLTFPASVEDFIDYQAQLCGRALGEYERSALEIWVPIFNDSYEDGRKNDQEALTASISAMDRVIAEHGDNGIFLRFLEVSRNWIACAWKQGRQKAEGEACVDEQNHTQAQETRKRNAEARDAIHAEAGTKQFNP